MNRTELLKNADYQNSENQNPTHIPAALDLGNTQTKMKTITGTYSVISQYLVEDDYGNQAAAGGSGNGLLEFTTKHQPDHKILWGPSLDNFAKTQSLTNTRQATGRYSQKAYQTLYDLALGYLAYQIFPNQNANFIMDLVVGLPTDDFNSKQYLKTLASFMKGEHKVQVNNYNYTIKIDNIKVLGQSQGTLYDLRFNELGEDKHPEYTDKQTTVIDYGGGTILYDQFTAGLVSHNSKQTEDGAYKFAEEVANAYNRSPEREKNNTALNQNNVLIMLRQHQNGQPFLFEKNPNFKINLTAFVQAEMQKSTALIIKQLKSIDDWEDSQYVIITGGGAHLIDRKQFGDFLKKYHLEPSYMKTPEFANVAGFYKYALAVYQNEFKSATLQQSVATQIKNEEF